MRRVLGRLETGKSDTKTILIISTLAQNQGEMITNNPTSAVLLNNECTSVIGRVTCIKQLQQGINLQKNSGIVHFKLKKTQRHKQACLC